ncbi:hypothetical protein [Nonomuraea dietziae]|uniref:hypothetical protein n=1 Tax=Nonomuraea dietziae TaxID=65515 RepID=UPI003414E1F3
MIGTLLVMGDGGASLRLEDVTSALETTLTALRAVGADLPYRVGGTSAALLQGVHLPAGDIDLLAARREDVDTVAAALSAFPCLYAASWLPETSQYFARYEVNGWLSRSARSSRRSTPTGWSAWAVARGSTTS